VHAGGKGFEEAQLAQWGLLATVYMNMEVGNHTYAAQCNQLRFGVRSFSELLDAFGASDAARAVLQPRQCECSTLRSRASS
jgi:hypothetical protein